MKAVGTPFVFTIIKKCQRYSIPFELMKRLNYSDLLALIIEYDIDAVLEYLSMESKRRNPANVITASNDDILRIHKKGR